MSGRTDDILSKPYLQNAGTTGFTVCLETRCELPGLRLVWTDGVRTNRTPFAFRRADFSGTYLAKARVEGLRPGTKVDYAVAGERGSFTTWTEGDGDFKCAIFGDYQGGYTNGRVCWEWEADPFLCGVRAFEDMVASGCDFAVTTGDLADKGDYSKEIRPLLLERTCGILGSKIPFFTAIGNHDSFYTANRFFLENPTEASFAFFRNNCLFVCVDDAEVGDDKHPGKASLREWFERLMASDAARRAKFRFVFQHVPVYVEDFGNCNRWLADLFEKYDVDCVFSGDHHGYERIVRGKTRQVVNGCLGYLERSYLEDPRGEGACLVNWYGDETLAGGHRGLPTPRTWRFQVPGHPGVLGPETPVREGLVPGYATLEVKGDVATWTLIGFNADGSKIGPIDSFTMKAGERPNAPKGLALERYCYRVSPEGKGFLKYTLTGRDGRVIEACEDEEWPKSRPIIEPGVVGVEFSNAAGETKTIRTSGMWKVANAVELARPPEPESLSGVTHVTNDVYLAVTDWGASVWEMHLLLDLDGVPTNCTLRKVCKLEKRTDVEGIALDPRDPNRLFVADEFANVIGINGLTNGQSLGEIRMTGALAKPRTDYGLESVAVSPDGAYLWTANEEAVAADGSVSDRDRGTDVRIARFRRDGTSWRRDGEYLYRTDPIAGLEWRSGKGAALSRSGVSDLCVMSDGTLLALEREFSIRVFLPCFRNRIYILDLSRADDVSAFGSVTNRSVHRVEKTLLHETSGFSMYEGLCQGPDLPNGDKTLVMVSDGDDLPAETVSVLRLVR